MTSPETRSVVALVTDAVAPYHFGGKEQRTAQIARHLTPWAEVHIYTMKWWSEPSDVIVTDDGVGLYAVAPKRELYTGDRRSIRQAVFFALHCLRLLWARFDRIEVDSIPVFPLFTTKIVCVIRRKQLVSTWHEVWGETYWGDYLGRWPGAIAAALERAAVRLPNHVIAASEHTAERIRPMLRPSQRLSVSRSGIDLQLVKQSTPSTHESDLCVVGRLLEHKRIDMLLEAVSLLRRQGVECRTLIVGSGPEEVRLQDLAGSLGIADLTCFRSDVAETTELYGLLKSSKVFVFPSAREGFGIVVLEAMACGLPVVTTSAPDNAASGLVQESGFGAVCDPTSEAIAAAARGLLAERTTARRPSPEGWLEQYSWERVAADLADVLQCA